MKCLHGRLAFLTTILCLLAIISGGCGGKNVAPPATENPATEFETIEHTVGAGETLDRIADNYYGDPGRAADIARDNGITPDGRLAAGSVLALRFRLDEFESARRRATALEPYNRGVDLMQQDRLAEAARQFEVALDTAPDLVAARYNLALVLQRRGMNEEALVLLEELTRQRPGEIDFHFARGHCLFQLTRFDEAADQFSGILAVDPGHGRAAFSLARSLQAAERVEEARAAWNRYLELDSTSSWAETARRNLRKLADDHS